MDNTDLKITVTKGLSASGKSTFAREYIKKNPEVVEVNRDNLRLVHPLWKPHKFNKTVEKDVKAQRDALVSQYLKEGKSVIQTDTNLRDADLVFWKDMAKQYNASFQLIDFTDPKSEHYVSVDTCIKRDLLREFSVGRDVILAQWHRLHKISTRTNLCQLSPHPPHSILVDLDGTLCHSDNRGPFEEKYDTDLCDFQVRTLIEVFSRDKYKILLVSGREGTIKGKQQTLDWLNKHQIQYDFFSMRKAGDSRCDTIVKREIYDTEIKDNYNVIFCVDDRPKVIRMWRTLGLKVFDVGLGLEF